MGSGALDELAWADLDWRLWAIRDTRGLGIGLELEQYETARELIGELHVWVID